MFGNEYNTAGMSPNIFGRGGAHMAISVLISVL
jgi:hypothetical protein